MIVKSVLQVIIKAGLHFGAHLVYAQYLVFIELQIGYAFGLAYSGLSELHPCLSLAAVLNIVWVIYFSGEVFGCIIFSIDLLKFFVEHSSLALAVEGWLQFQVAVFGMFVQHLMLGSIIIGFRLVFTFHLSFGAFQFAELAFDSVLIQ